MNTDSQPHPEVSPFAVEAAASIYHQIENGQFHCGDGEPFVDIIQSAIRAHDEAREKGREFTISRGTLATHPTVSPELSRGESFHVREVLPSPNPEPKGGDETCATKGHQMVSAPAETHDASNPKVAFNAALEVQASGAAEPHGSDFSGRSKMAWLSPSTDVATSPFGYGGHCPKCGKPVYTTGDKLGDLHCQGCCIDFTPSPKDAAERAWQGWLDESDVLNPNEKLSDLPKIAFLAGRVSLQQQHAEEVARLKVAQG